MGADMTAQIVKFPIIARPVSADRLAQIAMELATQQGAPDQAWRLLVQAGYRLYAEERENNAGSGRASS